MEAWMVKYKGSPCYLIDSDEENLWCRIALERERWADIEWEGEDSVKDLEKDGYSVVRVKIEEIKG